MSCYDDDDVGTRRETGGHHPDRTVQTAGGVRPMSGERMSHSTWKLHSSKHEYRFFPSWFCLPYPAGKSNRLLPNFRSSCPRILLFFSHFSLEFLFSPLFFFVDDGGDEVEFDLIHPFSSSQVYSPQPLYILTTDEGGKLGAKLDFVLVESGCQCQTWPLDQLGATMGVDPTVHQPLRIITGIDFDKDYFAMLAAIDAASAIAGPNQPTTGSALPTWTLSSESTAATTAGQVIDPHTEQLGNPTDATTRNSIQETGEMITSSMSSSTWSQESSHDLSDNEITSTSPTVVPTTLANILPLPELPDHGHPIAIPSGHFNPVLLSIQKFLKLPPPSTSSK